MKPGDPDFRKYSKPPYRVVLLHGGPGAIGYLAPVAEKLSGEMGIIDAYQTSDSINGIIHDLKEVISNHSEPPVIFTGHSWGAWLSIIYASRWPEDVKKLILVSTPPFQDETAAGIMNKRIDRMSSAQSSRFSELVKKLEILEAEKADTAFLEIASILRRADSFELTGDYRPDVLFSYANYLSVWDEARQMRSSGELLRVTKKIRCPVTAIHGDYDPHPGKSIETQLKGVLEDFRFLPVEKCGHEPWSEKHASNNFFQLLRDELS